jgi:hypothetical protein
MKTTRWLLGGLLGTFLVLEGCGGAGQYNIPNVEPVVKPKPDDDLLENIEGNDQTKAGAPAEAPGPKPAEPPKQAEPAPAPEAAKPAEAPKPEAAKPAAAKAAAPKPAAMKAEPSKAAAKPAAPAPKK